MQVAVIDLRDRSQFGWRGCLISSRIFQGEHLFARIDRAERSVRFVQTETYSGILKPIIGPFLKPLSRRAFRKMDRCPKSVCESTEFAEFGELVAPVNSGHRQVTIHNLRNCDYVTETEYSNCWTNRTVYLSQLSHVKLSRICLSDARLELLRGIENGPPNASIMPKIPRTFSEPL